jgi:diguanylate cyclase (GGDEF)-like protein
MLDPTDIDTKERALIEVCLRSLHGHLQATLISPVSSFAGTVPAALSEILNSFAELLSILDRASLHESNPKAISKREKDFFALRLPLLKRAVIQHRRQVAQQVQEKTAQTLNAELRAEIEKPLNDLTRLTQQEWFKNSTATQFPRITDLISVKASQQFLRSAPMVARVYDEKFGILYAAMLFRQDLECVLPLCETRGCPVSIAYLDIDDFKAFNTKYGEPNVDHEVLPRFMSALEAHIFERGHAYRYGGDEYVVLLPNLSAAESAHLMHAFQRRISALQYSLIPDGQPKPKVSVGIFEMNDRTMLTHFEGEERAARAKKYAKEHGKNCIAIFDEGSDQLTLWPLQ